MSSLSPELEDVNKYYYNTTSNYLLFNIENLTKEELEWVLNEPALKNMSDSYIDKMHVRWIINWNYRLEMRKKELYN